MNIHILRMLFVNIDCMKTDLVAYLEGNKRHMTVGGAVEPILTVGRSLEIMQSMYHGRDGNQQQDSADVLYHFLDNDLKPWNAWFGATHVTHCVCTQCSYQGHPENTKWNTNIIGHDEPLRTLLDVREVVSDSKCEQCGSMLMIKTQYDWQGKAYFFVSVRRTRPFDSMKKVEYHIVNRYMNADETVSEVRVAVLLSAVCYMPLDRRGLHGHYVTVLRQAEGKPWYVINDESVHLINDTTRHDLLRKATILFYVRPDAQDVIDRSMAESRMSSAQAEEEGKE
jgi:hypothetical protein